MSRLRWSLLVTFVALAGLGIGTFSFFRANQSEDEYVPRLDDPQLFLVPKRHIPLGTRLKADMFVNRRLVGSPVVNPVRPGYPLEGKVAQRDLEAGLVVLTRDVEPGNVLRDLKPDFRAMTIRIGPDAPSANFVISGCRVDLLSLTRDDQDPMKSDAVTFLQNVTVLAVQIEPGEGPTRPSNPSSIAIEVTPQQAEQVYAAMMRGRIGITIRKPGDSDMVQIRP